MPVDGWRTSAVDAAVLAQLGLFALVLGLQSLAWFNHRWLRRLLLNRWRSPSSTTGKAANTETQRPPGLEKDHRLGLAWRNVTYTTADGQKLLHGAHGYVNPGELMALMGPSGSGKTTLLNVLSGRGELDAAGSVRGRVLLNGAPITAAGAHYGERVAYLPQLAELFHAGLTVRENLTYAALLRLPWGTTTDEMLGRVDAVLADVRLSEVRDVHVGSASGGGISGGQKRKLMLGAELLCAPSLLFLDEPTSGLDALSALEMVGLLKSYCAQGAAAIVTIHQPRAEVFAAFDRLLLLARGRTCFMGHPVNAAPFLVRCALMLPDSDRRLKGLTTFQNPADFFLDVLAAEVHTSGTAGDHPVADYAAAYYEVLGLLAPLAAAMTEAESVARAAVRPLPRRGAAATRWVGCATRGAAWVLESRLLASTSCADYHAHAAGRRIPARLTSQFHSAPKAHVASSVLYNFTFSIPSIMLTPLILTFYADLSEHFRFEAPAGASSAGVFVAQHMLHSFAACFVHGLWTYAILLIATLHAPDTGARLLATLCMSMVQLLVRAALAHFLCVVVWAWRREEGVQLANVVNFFWHSMFGIFCGFYTSAADTPIYWRWFVYANSDYYTYAATLRINLEGRDFPGRALCDGGMGGGMSTGMLTAAPLVNGTDCTPIRDGDALLLLNEYERVDVAAYMWALVGFWLGFTALAAGLLSWTEGVRDRRSHHIGGAAPGGAEPKRVRVVPFQTPSVLRGSLFRSKTVAQIINATTHESQEAGGTRHFVEAAVGELTCAVCKRHKDMGCACGGAAEPEQDMREVVRLFATEDASEWLASSRHSEATYDERLHSRVSAYQGAVSTAVRRMTLDGS